MTRTGWAVLAVATLAMAGGSARAQEATAAAEEPAAAEKSWTLETGVDYSSNYLFRGVDLLGENDVLTPYARFGYGGLAVYSYGYLGEIPESDSDYREADFGADYTWEAGKLAITLGAVTYQYNGDAEREIDFLDTWEIYAAGSLDVLLRPTITYYHDMEAVEGGYATVGVSHALDLGRGFELDLAATLGFDFGYNLNAEAAEALGLEESNGDLNDLLAGADLWWSVSDAFAVHALVQRSVSLDVLDDLGQPDVTVWTVGAVATF